MQRRSDGPDASARACIRNDVVDCVNGFLAVWLALALSSSRVQRARSIDLDLTAVKIGRLVLGRDRAHRAEGLRRRPARDSASFTTAAGRTVAFLFHCGAVSPVLRRVRSPSIYFPRLAARRSRLARRVANRFFSRFLAEDEKLPILAGRTRRRMTNMFSINR